MVDATTRMVPPQDWRTTVDEETYLQILRFRRQLRRRLARFASGGRARADLLVSFPAAAVELVLETRPVDRRRAGLAVLDAGGSLRDVATALDLSPWLRRIPPEVLSEVDPRLPVGEEGQKLLAQKLPTGPGEADAFFTLVRGALERGDERFALWLAKVVRNWGKGRAYAERGLAPLAAFAFFSQHSEGEAGRLITRRWTAKMKLESAVQAAEIWLHDLRRQLTAHPEREGDTWLAGGRIAGYRFVPLMKPDALREEGDQLAHCVGTYADDVARDDVRIFSVRQGNLRVATLEIVPHPHQIGMPQIGQFYGRGNTPVREEIWKAAFLWLAKQQGYAVPGPSQRRRAPNAVDAVRWQAAMAPYWQVYGCCPRLPENPRPNMLERLVSGLQVWH